MNRFLFVCLLAFLTALPTTARQADPTERTVAEYRSDAERLIEAALADSAAWDRLAYLTDTFGPRFSGSENLELAMDWVLEEMERDGLENVKAEPVKIPHWVRGEEKLMLLAPHKRELDILGLGGSVGTGPDGIKGEVFVVQSFDELAANRSKAEGKIVLWNVPFTSYGATVRYRGNGAAPAAAA